MTIYARVSDGVVQEIIQPLLQEDGNEWPITDRFTANQVAQMVDVTNLDPQPACWWTYNGSTFRAPETGTGSAPQSPLN
ncbi:hypothetical protein [Caballeronia sp. dw_19]|uniref:hypothetical protein n=1 Tax=Caballeronia sp. dw_19 TaxID=2719791 RepID=UPI001BD1D00F|nr:hypothetical protein [Caballeronia sp. dw_19]